MTISVLCEIPRDRHLRRSVPRSVLAPHGGCPRGDPAIRGIVLSAFIYFLAQMDLRFEIIWNFEFEI